jgi:hypothetical protein
VKRTCHEDPHYPHLTPGIRATCTVRGHTISRGAEGAVLSAYVSVGTTSLEKVASWSVVRCIVLLLVSVGNVFRSGSSSERHQNKLTASRAPQQRLPFRAANVTRH